MATSEAEQTEAVKPPEAQQAPEKVSETAVKIKDFERTIRMQELEASKLDQMVLGQRGGIRFDEQEKDLIAKERGQEEKIELEKGYFGGGREAVKDKGIFKKIKNVKTFFGRKTYLPEEYKGKDNILSGLAYRDKPGSEEVVMSADESHIIERRGKREYYRTVVKERGVEGQIAMARNLIDKKLKNIEETTGARRKGQMEDLEASIADREKSVQEMMEFKELGPEAKDGLIKKLEGEEATKIKWMNRLDGYLQKELAPYKKLAEVEMGESVKMFNDISNICDETAKGLADYQERFGRAEETIRRLTEKKSLLPMERDVLKAATQKREEYQRIIEGLNTALESAEVGKSAMETRKDQAEAFMERLNNAGKTDKEIAEAAEEKRIKEDAATEKIENMADSAVEKMEKAAKKAKGSLQEYFDGLEEDDLEDIFEESDLQGLNEDERERLQETVREMVKSGGRKKKEKAKSGAKEKKEPATLKEVLTYKEKHPTFQDWYDATSSIRGELTKGPRGMENFVKTMNQVISEISKQQKKKITESTQLEKATALQIYQQIYQRYGKNTPNDMQAVVKAIEKAEKALKK